MDPTASTMTPAELATARAGGLAAALDDYQRWTVSTAQYPLGLALPYLALGIGDEAGELLEKYSLNDRPHLKSGWAQKHLLPELGDIGWYTAQLLLALDIRLSEAFTLGQTTQPEFDATLDSVVTEIVVRASKMQGRVKKSIRDGIDVRAAVLDHAARLLRAMDALARFYDRNLLLVLGENRAKLQARLEQGTIKGEGDHR